MSTTEKSESGGTAKTGTESDAPLKRQQGLIPLTALGVGAVISGDFFGWNFGLERGGFGGLMIATLLVGFMYVCVSLSLAELAAMYPSAEGAFAFSRRAFGPYVGFLCGLSETLEYVLLVPVIITGLGDQLNVLFGITDPDLQILWWALLCALYMALHLFGAQPTFWSNTIITTLSVLTLLIYWCVCVGIISGTDSEVINDRIYNIPADAEYSDSTEFLPKGGYGVFTSLVFAAWFFIAVEELPLAGEDAIDPTKNIPRALIGSISVLMVTAFLTAFVSVSVPGGSLSISSSGAPLSRALIAGLMDNCVHLSLAADVCDAAEGCEYSEDEGTCLDSELSASARGWEVVINLGTLIGLLTSCHAIIFAGGRQLYSLTRNGSFPAFTRFDVITNGTPRRALATDIVLAFLISLIVYFIGEGVDFLVGLSVAAACLSYTLSMGSFIRLRLEDGDALRPYRSPLGIFGAAYAAILSFLVGISFFVDIGVGLGATVLVVVIVVFIAIYALLSVEFLYGFGTDYVSGKQRFLEYEEKLKQKKEEHDGDAGDAQTSDAGDEE